MALVYNVREGRGPTIVCLPMFGTTAAFTSAALAPAFAGMDLREIYADLPGHGETRPLAVATSEAVLAEVTALIASFGPVLLAGFSYGGYLAAAVARRAPELIEGLLLGCPGVFFERGRRDLPADPPADPGEDWLAGVADRFKGHLAAGLGRRDALTAERVSRLLLACTGDEAFQERLQTGAGNSLPDEAAPVGYAGPTCMITGRQDRMVGFADQFRQMANYPRGSYTTLDEAGHYAPIEQPQAFRALVTEWLGRV